MEAPDTGTGPIRIAVVGGPLRIKIKIGLKRRAIGLKKIKMGLKKIKIGLKNIKKSLKKSRRKVGLLERKKKMKNHTSHLRPVKVVARANR